MAAVDDRYILAQCAAMIAALNATAGTSAKIEKLREYDTIKPLIRRIFSTDRTHMTPAGINTYCKKARPAVESKYTLYELFDALTGRTITGDAAKAAVCTLADRHSGHRDLVIDIMCKNIRIRMGEKTIQTAFPGMFQTLGVMLASDYDEARAKTQLASGRAFLSQKMDGVRVMAEVVGGRVTFYSRTGQEFSTLGVLREELARVEGSWMIDGEVVALDEKGVPNFKETVSQIRKKDVDMKNPQYRIFGIIPSAEWRAGESKEPFIVQLERMRRLPRMQHVEVLEQHPYSPEALERLSAEAKRNGWEGLMLRFDTPWESKRSKNLMKIKFMYSEEYRVLDATVEPMPFPNSTGGEDIIPAVKNLLIDHKGGRVAVGSGLTTEQRKAWAVDKNLIVGKIITVKFQEEFQDRDTGRMSLRCPILMAVYEGERDL